MGGDFLNADIIGELEEFFSKFKLLSVKPGVVLIEAGQSPGGVFYLKSGLVRMSQTSHRGQQVAMHFFKPGSFFPLTWAINGIPNTHEFSSEESSILHLIPKEEVIKFLKAHPDKLYDTVFRLLAAVSGLTKRIEVTDMESALDRVKSILVYLTKGFGVEIKGGVKLAHRFSHEDLAALTGLARETVSHQMKDLENAGLLRYEGRWIIISSIEALDT